MSIFMSIYLCFGWIYMFVDVIYISNEKGFNESVAKFKESIGLIFNEDPKLGVGVVQKVKLFTSLLLLLTVVIVCLLIELVLWPLYAFMSYKKFINREKEQL